MIKCRHVIIMILMEKILIFNNYYLPAKNYGGPVTSMVSIIENCSDEFEFFVIAANHDFGDTAIFENIQPGWNIVGKAKVKYISLSDIYFKPAAIRKILDEVKPDMVWSAGILVPSDKWFIAWQCKKMNIPYLISPRGEVCYNAFHTKHLKKAVVAFIARVIGVYKSVYFHSASELEYDGLKRFYGISEKRIFMVPNIPGLIKAKKHEINKNAGQIRIVFLSRIQDTKNLLLAIEAAELLKGDVIFDIYGPKESEEYWHLCEAAIDKAPDNVHIEYKGKVTPEKVRDVFSQYHCFLFPTITENYGHAIAEALSVSCPLVLTKGATPWDDIHGKAGYICKNGSKQDFAQALELIERMDYEEYSRLCNSVTEFYDKKISDDNSVQRHKEMIKKCIGSAYEK